MWVPPSSAYERLNSVHCLAAILSTLSVMVGLERGTVPKGNSGTRAVPAAKYTRFEKARILGARALQISLGAPVLVEVPAGIMDPLTIAEMEYEAKVIPITVIHV